MFVSRSLHLGAFVLHRLISNSRNGRMNVRRSRVLLASCHIFNFILNINTHSSHSEVEPPPADEHRTANMARILPEGHMYGKAVVLVPPGLPAGHLLVDQLSFTLLRPRSLL